MRTTVPEKILKIIRDLDTKRNVPVTRLTVLKKWFEHSGRLPAFGLWIARRAAARKGKTKGEAGALLDEARALLGRASTAESIFQQIDPDTAQSLHDRTRDFQNEYEEVAWGVARIIHCRPLLLVEKGLALHLRNANAPSDGYNLAVDWAENYNPLVGTGLNGPSAGKLEELVRFMFAVEALEEAC
jgi:hypothetical protein